MVSIRSAGRDARPSPARSDGHAAPLLSPLRRLAPRLTSRTTDASLAGVLLLATTSMVLVATSPLLPGGQGPRCPLAPGLAGALLAGLALALPWRRWHPLVAAALPATTSGVLAVSGALGRGDGPSSAYVGLLALVFVHAGLWLSARAGRWLLAPGALSCALLEGRWDRQLLLEVLVQVVVWLAVLHLLARVVQQQRQVEASLRGESHRDALTRLDNRRGLRARGEGVIGGEVVVMLDLDHFKGVNDSLGHAAGDAVLVDFAALLASGLRDGDHAARYGGEEFVLVLVDAGASDVAEVLRRLHAAWADVHPGITFSAGHAVHDPALPWAGTLEAADRALYEAKRAGRNRDVGARPVGDR